MRGCRYWDLWSSSDGGGRADDADRGCVLGRTRRRGRRISACVWIAEATVDGVAYTARSRHGAPNALARRLVAAGLADRPMVIRYQGLAGTMLRRSFHAAANWTYSEGDQSLRRVRYKERPEGLFSVRGPGQNALHRRRPMAWTSRLPT